MSADCSLQVVEKSTSFGRSNFGERQRQLREALDLSEEGQRELARLRREEATARDVFESFVVDNHLIALGPAIQELVGELGSYADKKKDRPRVQGEADEFKEKLKDSAVRLGLPARAEPLICQFALPCDPLFQRGKRCLDESPRQARVVLMLVRNTNLDIRERLLQLLGETICAGVQELPIVGWLKFVTFDKFGRDEMTLQHAIEAGNILKVLEVGQRIFVADTNVRQSSQEADIHEAIGVGSVSRQVNAL